MKKRSKETPRMLPYVVEAVTNLKDFDGSSARKILDQVHTAINVANVKPKPRNVVMQVKRALRHAVDVGVLKHKAGKYRLVLESKDDSKKRVKKRNKKFRNQKNFRKQRRRKMKLLRRKRFRPKRKVERKRYSTSVTSEASVCSNCRSAAYTTEVEKKSRNERRQRRSLAKKRVKIDYPQEKVRIKNKHRRQRPPTPLPVNPKPEEDEGSAAVVSEVENLENVFINEFQDQQNDNYGCETFDEPRIVEIPPECDNPECLCNLKQEPHEENSCDDNIDNIERTEEM